MTADRGAQAQRFRRVFEHIEGNLDEDLSLDRLSAVAGLSKHHFHRQFSALFGVGVYEYVRLLRFRRASFRLAFHEHDSILTIALDSGYDSHEAFTRAFTRVFGQTPSEFRTTPQWESWTATFERLRAAAASRRRVPDAGAVRMVDFAATRVAALEHRGGQSTIGESIRKFQQWRAQNGLPPHTSATFNIPHAPRSADDADVTFELCAATSRGVRPNDVGVFERTIPGGRCAVLRHVGPDDHLPGIVEWLYVDWLPSSGAELRDFPIYLQRVVFFPQVPEHEAVTDVFVPIR